MRTLPVFLRQRYGGSRVVGMYPWWSGGRSAMTFCVGRLMRIGELVCRCLDACTIQMNGWTSAFAEGH